MANNGVNSTSGLPQVRPAPLVTGGALIAAGGVIALAGLVVGGAHLFAATRRWIREMEIPPSEIAKLKLAQARAAASAGADAWQNGPRPGTRNSYQMLNVDLARWQFAFTTINHFLFVPVTIGLAFLTALLQTAWHRSGTR